MVLAIRLIQEMAVLSHSPQVTTGQLTSLAAVLPGKTAPHHQMYSVERTSLHGHLREFHLFPLLPPELRLRIWNLNLPACRLVPLHCDTSSPSAPGQLGDASDVSVGCVSTARIPANLHVCDESRSEALKSYAYAFGFARSPGRVPFNPDTDIVYFGPCKGFMAADSQFHTCMSLCNQAELAHVRWLAISDSLFWIDDVYRSMTAASLTVDVLRQLAKRMPSLERIIFVPRPEDEAGDLALVAERMRRQVQMAVATVSAQLVSWSSPAWDIVPEGHLLNLGG